VGKIKSSAKRRIYDFGGTVAPCTTALSNQKNPFFTPLHNAFHTEPFQFAVQDEWKISDAYTLNADPKGLSVKRRAREIIQTGRLAIGGNQMLLAAPPRQWFVSHGAPEFPNRSDKGSAASGGQSRLDATPRPETARRAINMRVR
jgi:hypothetical protein